MRKPLVWIGVLCMLLIFMACTQSSAQTSTPTPNYDLTTASHIIQMGTQTRMALPYTPVPPTDQIQTAAAIHSTRTAIAITRNPSLAISLTPNALELTAEQLLIAITQTHAAYTPPGPGTLNPGELRATEFIRRATMTAAAVATNPGLILTPSPTRTPGPCQPFLVNSYQSGLSHQVQDALYNVNIQPESVSVVKVGIDCDSEFQPLHTQFHIMFGAKDLFDDNALADLTAATLSVLTRFPPTDDYGPEPARLVIAFRQGYERRIIDTGYVNALTAFGEGLRDEALLEALGGLLPLWAVD